MNTYIIKAVFEHSYFYTVEAENYQQASNIITEAGLDSGDKRILEEGDGMFGDLIRIESMKPINKSQRLVDIK